MSDNGFSSKSQKSFSYEKSLFYVCPCDVVLGEHSLLERLTQTGPHGTWSQYDAYEAAAILQSLLAEHQANSTQHDINNAATV